MEPRRYLRCLGQPALFAATGEPIRFRTRKHLALLVYIAVEPRPHRRDQLAELLWPKVTPTEARHSLATALSTLRPRLGPDGLESSRDQVRLTPGRVSLDLDRLRSGDILGSEVTGPLEVAAFLDGFDIADSPEFTHWKDRQQARLLPMIKDALRVLIDRCRRTGDSRQIEQLADRMLALDELSEEAIRAKMEARAFAGDRLTALEIFEEWKAKLAEELQAVPSELVEGMAVRLRRRGWERTTLTNIPPVPTDQWRGKPFIGRTREYCELYEIWEGVRRGVPGHALILGDSGVGKTTLVHRLTTAAGLEGAAISRVQCYDIEREIPYSTLNSLVLGLLDRPGSSATSPEALAELSRTVPEVRRRFPLIPDFNHTEGESARIRQTEAFLELLTAIAEEHPVILVIDDLHVADDVSLAVLHLIMRRARKLPLMLVFLARPGELTQSSQAAQLREGAAGLGICEIHLRPLDQRQSREMLDSLISSDEPRPEIAVQRAVLRAAAGYPMVLELLVQDWKVNGQQSLALAVDAMTFEVGLPGKACVTYGQILERITRSLDRTTQNVLNLASILGHRLNDFTLYKLVDISAAQTIGSMAELVERRVLRDGAQGLEFVNELVRTAAYARVPSTLRRALHGNIADRLIQQHKSGDDDLGLEIAWHCIRAGRGAEATPYLLQGARQAIRSGAPYEAERGLSTALSHLAEADRDEALVLLTEALQEQGRWDESLSYIEQVADSKRSSWADLAYVLRCKARRYVGYANLRELATVPEQLLAFIESPVDKTSRIRAAVEAACTMNMVRCRALATRVLDSIAAIRISELPLEDAQQLLLARSMLLYTRKDFKSSLECIAEAIALLQRNRVTNSVLAMLQTGAGAILAHQGAYEMGTYHLLKSYDTAMRVGNTTLCLQASGNLALAYMRLGDYSKSICWAEQALNSDACDAVIRYLFQAAESAVLSYAMVGEFERAERLIMKRKEWLQIFGSCGFSQAWALHAADAFLLMGKYVQAQEEGIHGTTGENSQIHIDLHVGPFARWIARTSHYLHQHAYGHDRLDCLLRNIEFYDLVDQADILNAKTWLLTRENQDLSPYWQLMNERLEALPTAVREQLRRMGMLDLV